MEDNFISVRGDVGVRGLVMTADRTQQPQDVKSMLV